jgi:hypothetical protein
VLLFFPLFGRWVLQFVVQCKSFMISNSNMSMFLISFLHWTNNWFPNVTFLTRIAFIYVYFNREYIWYLIYIFRCQVKCQRIKAKTTTTTGNTYDDDSLKILWTACIAEQKGTTRHGGGIGGWAGGARHEDDVAESDFGEDVYAVHDGAAGEPIATSTKKPHPTVTKDSKKIQSNTKVLLNHITGMGR